MTALDNLSDQGKEGLILSTVCCGIAGIAVALRFICKSVLKTGYHADDWFIVATLATYWASAGVTIWGLFEGDGLPEKTQLNLEPEILAKTNKYLAAIFWGVTVIWLSGYFVKVSICLFYRQLFSAAVYRKASLILIGLSTAWIIATEISNLVTCIPVSARWHIERQRPGTCKVNFNTMYLLTGCIETVLDATVLAVPVRVVLKLQMSMKTRLTVAGIFLLGGFAVVTDIIRMVFIYQPGSEDVNFKESEFWLAIHMAVSILCACLPTFKPLWTKVSAFIEILQTRFATSVRYMNKQLHKAYKTSRLTKASSELKDMETEIINAQIDGFWFDTSTERSESPRWVLPSLENIDCTIDIADDSLSSIQAPVSAHLSRFV